MTTSEIKLARAIAQDQSVDLSGVDDSPLFGFGCRDFVPVTVSILAVAKCMRWQCCTFAGGWDEKQYSEDTWGYKRNVRVAELSAAEARAVVVEVCGKVMAG